MQIRPFFDYATKKKVFLRELLNYVGVFMLYSIRNTLFNAEIQKGQYGNEYFCKRILWWKDHQLLIPRRILSILTLLL